MSDTGLAKLILDGDSSGLVRALEVAQRNMGNAAAASADLTKTVDSEMKAAEGAAKAVETASKATATMGTAAKAAAVPVRTLEQRIGRTKEGMAQLGAAVSVVSPRMGTLVMQASALTGAAKAAAAGLNPVVLGVAALGAASLGAVSAMAALAGAAVKLVSASDEMNKKLQPLRDAGFAIGAIGAEAERLDRSAASLDAVGSAFAGLGVTIATQVAPAVEEVATLLIAMTLSINDTIKRVGVLDLVLGAFVEATLVAVVNQVTGVIGSFLSLADVAAATARAMGAGGLADALDAVATKWNGVVAAATKPIKTGSAAALGAAYDEMAGNLGEYMEQTRALIGAQDVANDKIAAGGKAAKEAANDMSALVKWATELSGTLAAEDMAELDQAYLDIAAALAEVERELANVLDRVEGFTFEDFKEIAGTAAEAVGLINSGLAGMAATIGGPVVGALAQVVLAPREFGKQLPAEIESLPKKAERLIPAMTDLYKKLASALPSVLPEIVTGLVEGLIGALTDPSFWKAVVKMNVELIKFATIGATKAAIQAVLGTLQEWWDWFTSGGMREAVESWWQNMKDGISDWMSNAAEEFGRGLRKVFSLDFWRDVLRGFGRYVRDLFTEIVSLGEAETKTFGDTPGPVRVSSSGMAARFSPGDTVIAARDPARLLAQAVQAFAAAMPSQAPAMAGGAPAPSYSDTHRIFSAFEREHLRARTLPGSVTGRRY